MQSPFVFITGIGVISSIGIGREEFCAGVHEGRQKTGTVEGFRVEDYLASAKTYLDRCSAFTLAACALALQDAGVSRDQLPADGSQPPLTHHASLPDGSGSPLHSDITDPSPLTTHHSPTGLCLGTSFGCLQTMQDFFQKVLEKGPRFANSLLFSHSYANSPTSLAAIEFGLSGYHATVTAGALSGVLAVMQAVDAIRLGYADRMVAGGVDALSEPVMSVWEDLFGDRIPGEGAAFFVLENEDSLKARGAQAKDVPRLEVEWTDETVEATDFLQDRVGFAMGASGALEVAAALARLAFDASKSGEVVSKDSAGSAVRVRLRR